MQSMLEKLGEKLNSGDAFTLLIKDINDTLFDVSVISIGYDHLYVQSVYPDNTCTIHLMMKHIVSVMIVDV